jgi:hypothetical protein
VKAVEGPFARFQPPKRRSMNIWYNALVFRQPTEILEDQHKERIFECRVL